MTTQEAMPSLLVVGGQGSGMSTLLEQLRAYSRDCCIPARNMQRLFPTIGVDVTNNTKINGHPIRIIEVGGSMISHAYRQLSQHEFNGLLFVIDCTQPEELSLTVVELYNLIKNEKLSQTPFLVAINKADAPAKLPIDIIHSFLGLDEIKSQSNITCIETSGATGHNINLLAEWIKDTFNLYSHPILMLGSGHTLDDLFGTVLKKKDREEDDEEERDQVKRRPLRRWDYENHCWVEIDPNSSNAEDILATPGWMRKEPKWLQRKVLDDAGLVSPTKTEKQELVKHEEPTEENIEKATTQWDELGQLPHTKLRVRFDDDDDTEMGTNEPKEEQEEETGCLPSGPRKKMLYNFCLNRDCPQYHIRDLPIQQSWRGECCGMTNQPAPGGGILNPLEQEDEESEEDWEITDNVLQEIMEDDPETATMLKQVQGFYSGIDEDLQTAPSEAAACAAVLSLLSLSCPLYESFPTAEEEEEETDSEDSEESGMNEACFLSQCTSLIEATTDALDGMVCEPFTSMLSDLKTRVSSYSPDSDDFDTFKEESLELIKSIRSEFYSHKRQTRPPKTNIVIDGKTFDI